MPQLILNTPQAIILKTPPKKPARLALPLQRSPIEIKSESVCYYTAINCLVPPQVRPPANVPTAAVVLDMLNTKLRQNIFCINSLKHHEQIFKAKFAQEKPYTFVGNQQKIERSLIAELSKALCRDETMNEMEIDTAANDFVAYIMMVFNERIMLEFSERKVEFATKFFQTSEFLSLAWRAGQDKLEEMNDINTAIKFMPNLLRQAKKDFSQYKNFSGMLKKYVAENYGIKFDLPWKPTSQIGILKQCLQSHGPLLASGFHRISLLQNSADLDEKHNLNIGHVIVVMGTSVRGFNGMQQDLVYYIDPAHDKDNPAPNYPIYMMSYKSFCECASTSIGAHEFSFLGYYTPVADMFSYKNLAMVGMVGVVTAGMMWRLFH